MPTPLRRISRIERTPGGAGWHLNQKIWASFIWKKNYHELYINFSDFSKSCLELSYLHPLQNINKQDKGSIHEEFFILCSCLKFRQSLWFIICNHIEPCSWRGVGDGQCPPLTNRKCGPHCHVTQSEGHLISQSVLLIEIRKETMGPKSWGRGTQQSMFYPLPSRLQPLNINFSCQTTQIRS